MQYVSSNIGISDEVIINDINYAAIPGPSFSPGIGGTFKQEPPPHKPAPVQVPEFDIKKHSPGCEFTISAGDGTKGFCTAKTVTCDLGRPHEPQRHIEPGRLDITNEIQTKLIRVTQAVSAVNAVAVAGLAYVAYMLLMKSSRN